MHAGSLSRRREARRLEGYGAFTHCEHDGRYLISQGGCRYVDATRVPETTNGPGAIPEPLSSVAFSTADAGLSQSATCAARRAGTSKHLPLWLLAGKVTPGAAMISMNRLTNCHTTGSSESTIP